MTGKIKYNISLLSVIIFAFCGVLLCFPVIQTSLLILGGKLLGRALTYPYAWYLRMYRIAFAFFCFAIYISFSSLKTPKLLYSKYPRFFLVLGIILIAFFSSSLFYDFPLGNQEIGADSSAFIYIGRGMHNGKIPYKDMFDHKGIYLYFFEYIGTFVSGIMGVYLVELITLFVASFYIYKTTEFITKNKVVQLFTTICIVCFMGKEVYDGGNLTEIYALPCIAYSNYIFLKYLKSDECKFVEFFITGITFSIVLLLRLNMVGFWVFYVFYFLISLLIEKKSVVLIKMIISFTSGVITGLIPALLYFFFTKSFVDMWNSYILFNFKYTSELGGIKTNLQVAKMFIEFFFIPFVCMVVAFFKNIKIRYHRINFVTFFVTLFFVVISGRQFPHYGIILLPFFAIPLSWAIEVFRSVSFNFNDRKKMVLTAGILLTVLIIVLFMPLSIPTNEKNDMIIFLEKKTKPEDDVLMLGFDMRIYIVAERYTKQRFFYQLPIVLTNPSFLEEFLQSMELNLPDCIIVSEYFKNFLNNDNKFSSLKKILENHYQVVEFKNDDVYIKL